MSHLGRGHNLVELGAVLSLVRNGLSIKQSKVERGLPITRIETIADGTINPDRVGYADVKLGDKDEWLMAQNDILFSHINSEEHLGKCALYEGEPPQLIHGMNLLNLRGDTSRVAPRYLLHALRSNVVRRQVSRVANRSVNQASISITSLKNLAIPLPPLPEQKRTAAILDKADAIRRKRQEAQGLLASVGPALYQERFGDPVHNRKGWDVVPFVELFAVSPNYGTMVKPNDTAIGWLDLRVANIQAGKLDLRDRKYVVLPDEMIERHEVREGDLLLARAIGSIEHLGKCIIAHPGSEKWAFDSHLMRVRFKPDRVLPRFVHAFLTTPGGRHEFLRNSRRSAVQFNINTKEMARIQIPLPPLAKQQEFIQELDCINGLSLQQTATTTEIDDLFNSLVQRAFRGEL
jgi:type I restriction enzyme, S subunit